MKCPECAKEDKKSKVFEGYTTSTDMYSSPYYDEEGNYHHHDLNRVNTNYSCSNGHFFSVNRPNKCHCGWTSEGF